METQICPGGDMRYSIILMIVILFVVPVKAAGDDGLILIFPVSARGLGMGEAYSTIVDDSTALSYNPAGLGKTKNISAHYSFMNFIFGQSYHNTAGAYRIKNTGVIGLGYTCLVDEGFKLTTPVGESDIIVGTSSWFLSAGYGYEFKKGIFVGGNIKYIQEEYTVENEDISSSGIGFGIGALAENIIIGNVGLSCVLKNYGFKGEYENGAEGSVPFDITFGGKYDFGSIVFMKKIVLCSDISINDYKRTGLKIGGEGQLSALPGGFNAAFRTGFQLPWPVEGHFISGLFTGLGVTWQNYGLDYAFTYTGLVMGTIHYLTLKLNM